MIKFLILEFITLYFLISLNNLEKKNSESLLNNEKKNLIVIIIVVIIIILLINNIIIYMFLILIFKTRNTLIYLIRIFLLQTYYYYFLKKTYIKNNSLKLWLSSIDSIVNVMFFSKKILQIFKIMFFVIILIKFPLYLVFILYSILELKNYYLYTLDYIYDSYSLCYFFEEEIFLTESGRLKIEKYRKNLILGIKDQNSRLEYYIDYNHIEY